MKSFFALCLLLVPAQIVALKLLSSENQQMLESEDLLENDDDEWESDIQFSFTPFKGGCKKAGGAEADKTPAGGNECPGPSACYAALGELTQRVCDDEQLAKDKLKYCTLAPLAANVKFETVKDAWMTYLDANNLKYKCPHYYAKLASMSNKILPSAEDVESFAIRSGACANNIAYKTVAVEGGIDKGSPDWYCYTKAGITWAKNDPKVKNMDGQEFEIMATGTFSMLKLETSSQRKVLEVLAMIDRAGTRCGATYIQNISLSGQWVEDIGVQDIQIKAETGVSKVKALQVKFDKEWRHASSHWSYDAVQKGNAREFTLKLGEVTVMVSVDAHRIQELGSKTKRFANFLNVNFGGISNLSGISVGGLLGRDSHEEAEELPEGCESTNLRATEGRISMLSRLNIA